MLSLNANVKNSEQMIKRYGEIGSPCRQPRLRVNGSERWPFSIILEFDDFWKIDIHLIIFSPKLSSLSEFYIYYQERLSKAFSKSTKRMRPSVIFLTRMNNVKH